MSGFYKGRDVGLLCPRYLKLATRFSVEYCIAQAGLFFLLILLHAGSYSPAFEMQKQVSSSGFDMWFQAALHATHFVFLSHVLLRPFVQLCLLQRPLTAKLLGVSVLFFLLLAVLQMVLTMSHVFMASLVFLLSEQLSSLAVVPWSSMREQVLMGFIPVVHYMVLFGLWGMVYSAIQLYLDRKVMAVNMRNLQSAMLLSQINPHFLFNAFNSIRALIHEDKDKAADMVTCLAGLFRDQLQSEVSPTASLKEELSVAKQYLDIEKVRFEERLNVTLGVDESTLAYRLPRFTLLTLVENAVKHGISCTDEVGDIFIDSTLLPGDRWQLAVVNRLLPESEKVDGFGLGLKNLNQRLELLCRQTSRLYVTKKQTECGRRWFSVSVELVCG